MILYNLRWLRLRAHLTQHKLGCAVGVDSTAISRWETLRAAARPAVVLRLADVLGVTPKDLTTAADPE